MAFCIIFFKSSLTKFVWLHTHTFARSVLCRVRYVRAHLRLKVFSDTCVIMCSYWSISVYGVTIYPIVLSHWFSLTFFSPIMLDVKDHWDLPTWPLQYHAFPLVFASAKHLQHSGIFSSLAWPAIPTSTILHLFPVPDVNHIVSVFEILE